MKNTSKIASAIEVLINRCVSGKYILLTGALYLYRDQQWAIVKKTFIAFSIQTIKKV